MNLFELVKESVTMKQAAEHYGCKVNRGDMICCPFHDDRHPSMKLNRDYFYCFGCGATGDVIDFVARLFGLSSYEAAKKLAYDFGIDPDKPPAAVALVEDFPPEIDRIHLANGTLFLDGNFVEGKPEIVRNRLPVAYHPNAPTPTCWLAFLDGLLYPEDIPTLQEYIGYCLIPINKGQRMMVIKGSGGEGKSQIGAVLGTLFGSNMKDGSIGKISENRFARADLEHILLCVDDDMRMEALRQTNYVKSIVTAQGKMDLERKGKQSYQGWMCARLLAFSNGDLQALFDRSDGFYRRQLVLTTKEKPADRVDDPDLAEKMKMEIEGIFLWAFARLQRLVANNFKFTESQRTRENREAVKRDNNNVFDFLESEGYIRLKADASISSKELYEAYQIYCAENNLTTMKPRSFSDAVIGSQSRYNLEYCNNVTNAAGRRVRGFFGIEALVHPNISVFSGDSLRTYVPRDTSEGWRD